jgi:signal transduction histidine kinase
VSDQVTFLVLHLVLYGLPALLIARLKFERVPFFYAYFGFLFVFTQLFAVLYSIRVSGDLTITGGNIAYSSLILITMIIIFITRDASVVRNLIIIQVILNVFLSCLYLLLSAVLLDPETLDIFSIPPGLFSTTVAINIISSCVFVVEILLLFLLLEHAKRMTKNVALLAGLNILVFIGILCLDGFLFPFLTMIFIPVFGQFIVGGVIGKVILGAGFSPFLLLFFVLYKKIFMKYLQTPISIKQMLVPARERLLKQLAETKTKLVQSEKNYIAAYKEAKLYKDMFTHDITNIIQVIMLNLQLYNSAGDKVTGKVLQEIQSQVSKAVKLIENVRKSSEMEDKLAGLEVLDTITILHDIVAETRLEFLDKIEIEFHASNTGVKVRANTLLAEIFNNLISNAIRYNNSKIPRIDIHLSIEDTGQNSGTVNIEFIDNGIGIPDDRKKIIFEEGHQDKKSGKGMGLGLSLVSKAIGMFGGDVHVEDRIAGNPGQGSKFIVHLPRYREIA